MIPTQDIWMPRDENRDTPLDQPRQQIGQSRCTSIRPDGGKTTLNDVMGVLANPRRRAVFYYLQEHEVASVAELAHHLAEQTAEGPTQGVEDYQVEQITLSLLHNTLPKLADSQFIEYDPTSRTVRYTQPPELLDTVLRFLARFE